MLEVDLFVFNLKEVGTWHFGDPLEVIALSLNMQRDFFFPS